MDKGTTTKMELTSGTSSSIDTAATPTIARDTQLILEEKRPGSDLMWPRFRAKYQNFFSEFMGVFVMILFGCGSVAQSLLSSNKNGNFITIFMGWGLGVMLGVYCGGKSGADLNPAVTLATCVFRGRPWKKLPYYMLAQTLGAMAAAAVVYANYKSAIDAYEGVGIRTVPGYSNTSTAGIFCTYPAAFLSKTGQFFSEFIASSILMFVIFALKDENNIGSGDLTPLMLFFLILGIGACFGWETGYALNFARDFGPRLVSYMIGYGTNVWKAGDYYFWVPMVAPFFGTTFGAFLYDLTMYDGESPINEPYFGLMRWRTFNKSSWSNSGV